MKVNKTGNWIVRHHIRTRRVMTDIYYKSVSMHPVKRLTNGDVIFAASDFPETQRGSSWTAFPPEQRCGGVPVWRRNEVTKRNSDRLTAFYIINSPITAPLTGRTNAYRTLTILTGLGRLRGTTACELRSDGIRRRRRRRTILSGRGSVALVTPVSGVQRGVTGTVARFLTRLLGEALCHRESSFV